MLAADCMRNVATQWRMFRMPTPSRRQIIQSKPIAGGLDRFRAFFNATYEDVGIPETSQVLGPAGNEGIVDTST